MKDSPVMLLMVGVLCCLAAVRGRTQAICECQPGDALRPRIGALWGRGELDSAELLIEQLAKPENLGCQAAYLDSKAQLAISRKQVEEARRRLRQEERLLAKGDCPKALTRHYNTYARFYQEISLIDSASHYLYRAVALAEQSDDVYAYARGYVNLGVIQVQLGNVDKALGLYQRGLEAAYRVPDSILVAAALSRISSCLFSIYKDSRRASTLDSAYLAAQQTVAVARKHSLLDLLDAYNILANYHIEINKPHEALRMADSILQAIPAGAHDFERHLNGAYMCKSDAMLALGRRGEAISFADSALAYALTFNPQVAAPALERIYLLQKEAGNYAAALSAYERWQGIKDTIFTQQKAHDIEELERQYNQARNESTIRQLKVEKRLLYALAVLALISLGGGYLYYNNRLLKQKQLILETEQRLNRARMNPHFFFNALSSLQSFVMNESDAIALAENLSKFSHIMRETLENTYREYVTIRQEMEFLSEYIELQQMRFPGKFNFDLRAEPDLDVHLLLIPSMLVQPFIENGIEHGFRNLRYTGELSIRFYAKGTELYIDVTDNGAGLNYNQSPAKPYVSRASQIIKDRIFLLNLKLKTNASFSISNREHGPGVHVLIKLPLIYENENAGHRQ
jgi:hypothetical protein